MKKKIDMRILKNTCFLIIILIIFTILLSCSNKKTESSFNLATNQFDIVEFKRNRELWTSKNIQNYKMLVGARGWMRYFPNQALIEVQNHRAISIKSLSETNEENTVSYQNLDTIEKIFEIIERASERKAERLNVEYDKTLGYPLQVTIDERFDTGDDEISVTIKSLEVVKKFGNEM